MIQDWMREISQVITKRHVFGGLSAALILIIGLYLAKRASNALSRLSHLDPQQRILVQKFGYYGLCVIVLASALNQLGFDLRVLLGAAGVMTVAIGFAAQTSASNLISGLFLMVDRPFVVGNFIDVGGLRGEVLSIDLLSCRLRTPDNLLVRVPNETMVKSNIINLTHFPIRRIDLTIGVSYSTDLRVLQDLLFRVAERNIQVLEDPKPVFIFQKFGESSMDILFAVWTLTENFGSVQTVISREIKEALDAQGIEIPYPTRTLHIANGGAGPVKSI